MKLKPSARIILGLFAGLLAVVITSCSSAESKEAKKPEEQKEVVEATKSLFVSPEKFKTEFNKFCIKNSFDFRISKKLEIVDGEVQNSFQYMFNDNIGIIGSINKSDGSVKEVTMIGRGNGIEILSMMAAIIGVSDPELPAEGRGEILKDLKLMGDDAADLTDHEAKIDRNNVHYFVNTSEAIGVMFGASRL